MSEKTIQRPKEVLLAGVKTLKKIMVPSGFKFHFRGEQNGSGGKAPWGEFVRRNRRLELHFRYSLGLVSYRIGQCSASHESYMRQLGIWTECRYPGFSDDPLAAFHDLAHDLQFAQNFLSGPCMSLKEACSAERSLSKTGESKLNAAHAGDTRTLKQMRDCFREEIYAEVVDLGKALRHPELLTEAERKLLAIAQKKIRKG